MILDEPWAMSAACRGSDTEIFFSHLVVDQRRAQALCSGCPVREPCLEKGLADRPQGGWWGGQNANTGELNDYRTEVQ